MMDITLMTVIGSVVIVLIAIAISVKKVLKTLSDNKSAYDEQFKLFKNDSIRDVGKLRNDINSSIDLIQNYLKSNLKESNTSIDKLIITVDDKFDGFRGTIKDYVSSQNEKLQSSNKLIKDDIDKLYSEMKKNVDLYDKQNINLKNSLNSSFQNTIQLVNNLRLDNLINVSNEINKYKEGVYEDDHFLQEVGHCKILKITDKQSGDITNVYYDESGSKSYTETFNNESLKYKMEYVNGILSKGSEYNDKGDVVFAYKYDEVGEVNSKVEYIYDTNGTQIDEIKKDY